MVGRPPNVMASGRPRDINLDAGGLSRVFFDKTCLRADIRP